MSKRIVWVVIVGVLLLAACGGGESEEGIELEVAGGAVQPTDTPTPEPVETVDAAQTGSADIGPLAGTLLLLRGGTFELYDLESGESTVIEGPHSYSPAFLNHAETHGAFSTFPDFGILDIPAQAVTIVENRASNPNGFALSPDGAWLVTFTGQFTNRLQVLAVDGAEAYNVATSSETTFGTVWTADSKLVWWENNAPEPVFQVFDPLSGESAPMGADDPEIVPPVQVAPDGSQAAAVPVAFRPQNPAANPNACFDSYVEFFDAPFTLASMSEEGAVAWTERGLVASSAQWLDSERLLFVRLGTGECGEVRGEPDRMILMMDATAAAPDPVPVAGPLGNADDPNDRTQRFGKQVAHLYSPSPDGRYIAWIGGGMNAQESVLYVTDVQTGATAPLLRMTREEAGDAATYIEQGMFRQVAWLE